MPIILEAVNVEDLTIFRPTRTGPGGDEGTPEVIGEDLCAITEASTVVIKDPDGREQRITANFRIDPCDCDGDLLDVREGDHLQYTDFRNVLQKRQLIRRVSPFFLGSEVDHILLEIG